MIRLATYSLVIILLLGAEGWAKGLEIYTFRMPITEDEEILKFYRFSGDRVTLPVALNWNSREEVAFAGDLFQVSSGVAIPIRKNIQMAKELRFFPGAYSKVDLVVEIPEVKAPSLFVLKLAALSDGEESSRLIKIQAYPPLVKTQKELKKLLEQFEEKREIRVQVFGEKNPFRSFLEQSNVAFVDGGADIPSQWDDSRILFIGSVTGKEANEIFSALGHRLPDSCHLILFVHDGFFLFPGIYPQPQANNGARTKVCLPILYQMDDPRAWETCLYLLQDQLKQI